MRTLSDELRRIGFKFVLDVRQRQILLNMSFDAFVDDSVPLERDDDLRMRVQARPGPSDAVL